MRTGIGISNIIGTVHYSGIDSVGRVGKVVLDSMVCNAMLQSAREDAMWRFQVW